MLRTPKQPWGPNASNESSHDNVASSELIEANEIRLVASQNSSEALWGKQEAL
jgi:hypothetical protein